MGSAMRGETKDCAADDLFSRIYSEPGDGARQVRAPAIESANRRVVVHGVMHSVTAVTCSIECCNQAQSIAEKFPGQRRTRRFPQTRPHRDGLPGAHAGAAP